MKSPMTNCYCRNLSSENIEKAYDYCSGDYESCEIFQTVFRVDEAINDSDDSELSFPVVGLATGSERSAQLQTRQKLLLSMLELLGKNTLATTMYRDFVLLLRHFTEIEGITLYLTDSEQQRSYRVVGCQDDMVTEEQHIGKLGCICGDIIGGSMDSTSLNKTDGGVFWSNDRESLSDAEEKALNLCVCARCPEDAGGSVVLVPINYRGQVIGVLRILDQRKGLFTRDDIQFLEGLSAGLGIIVIQSRADESRIYSEMFIDSVQNPIIVVDADFIYRKVNKKFCQCVSLLEAEVLGKTFQGIVGDALFDRVFNPLFQQALCGERAQSTTVVAFPGRDKACYLITCQPNFGVDGVVDAINICMHEEIDKSPKSL
ncbi:MAG: PAS domain-containing protein [Deltaproteobacteria bacterium]|nr:PAS domain-containing protein [Deltaproteobacteria bacterium]